jgi:hypothetical protein
MPITSDQVIDIIDLAIRNFERVIAMEKVIQGVNKDMKEIKYLVKDQNEKVEFMIGDIIVRTNPSPGIPAQDIQELMYMKAKFEINKKRNSSAARRMRGKRERDKERDFMEGIMQPRNSRVIPKALLDLEGQEDQEYFKQRGQENHPELGDCDGEPCRKCEEKEKEKDPGKQYTIDETRTMLFSDDGIKYKPAKDENDEWKPRNKEEKQ